MIAENKFTLSSAQNLLVGNREYSASFGGLTYGQFFFENRKENLSGVNLSMPTDKFWTEHYITDIWSMRISLIWFSIYPISVRNDVIHRVILDYSRLTAVFSNRSVIRPKMPLINDKWNHR